LWMPGPFEQNRLLGLELQLGALDGARGMIVANGRPQPRSDLALLVAQERRANRAHRRRAA